MDARSVHSPHLRLAIPHGPENFAHRIMVGMGVDDSLAQEIVRRLLKVSNPERIILFGSAATGEMNRNSDIDLLLVANQPSNTVEDYTKLYQALRDLGFPFDVFVIGTELFEQTKSVFGGIAYPAHKYGRVIYAA